MSQKDICRRCPQEDKCRDTYDRMGRFRGPSVFFRAISAFLLPLVLFIVSLAVFERVLKGIIKPESLRPLASFTAAGALVVIYALITAAFSKKNRRKEKK